MRQRAYVEIWSTREVWRERKRRKNCSRCRATLASFVLSKLLKCFISRHTHSRNMNQLFYNISMQSMQQWTKRLLLHLALVKNSTRQCLRDYLLFFIWRWRSPRAYGSCDHLEMGGGVGGGLLILTFGLLIALGEYVPSKVIPLFMTTLHQKHLAKNSSVMHISKRSAERCIILWLAFRIPNPFTIHLELLP